MTNFSIGFMNNIVSVELFKRYRTNYKVAHHRRAYRHLRCRQVGKLPDNIFIMTLHLCTLFDIVKNHLSLKNCFILIIRQTETRTVKHLSCYGLNIAQMKRCLLNCFINIGMKIATTLPYCH